MTDTDAPPQPERLEGTPHPRDTLRLIGQNAAEAAFLDAFNGGRLHHAWLLSGPRGVGKATLAWRIARFLLATPAPDADGMFAPEPAVTLDIAADHPVAKRITAGAEPRVHLLRLGGVGSTESERAKNFAEKKYSSVIRVDEVRELSRFLNLSATDGGYRAVIVDDADLMNPNAANALLKMLEEPPARTVLLLISHRPSGLLPTIRSRCRTLPLRTLDENEIAQAMQQAGISGDAAALAALSGGSPGGAMRLAMLDGAKLYGEVMGILGSMPHMDRDRALALAEKAATRGKVAQRDLIFTLIEIALTRLARTGAMGAAPAPEALPGEAKTLTRLAPSPAQGRIWADLGFETGARTRHGLAVNLDPAALVLDTLRKISDAAPR